MRGNSRAIFGLVVLVAAGCAAAAASAAGPAAAAPANAPASWQSPDPDALPNNAFGGSVRLGRDLIAHTSVLLGPDAADPRERFAGNGLDCASCHLKAGMQRFALPLVGIWRTYPAFSARLGKIETMTERVNDCMERSMNGRPLPANGPDMRAILAYLQFIGSVPDTETPFWGHGVPKLRLPDHAADPGHGRAVYRTMCAACHGPAGAGVRYSASEQRRQQRRYLYPPLWGPDSYNDGAGMARNITAAWFVHANMPDGVTFADPILSVDDAYDVAAYVNQHPRPNKARLDADYPDRWLKPPDAAFPPLLGPFPPLQHALGPWRPISEWLKAHSPTRASPPAVD